MTLPKTAQWNRLLFLLLEPCLLIILSVFANADDSASVPARSSLAIEAAETAYIQMNLDLSRRTLEKVWADADSIVEDRVNAAQKLAIQDWKFFMDYDGASARLKQAEALGVKKSVTWQTLSRIAREHGNHEEAQAAARKAIKTAESEAEKRASQIALAQAIHDQAIQNRNQGKKPDRSLLNEAHKALRTVLAEEPGLPAASRLLLGISLLRQDGPTALKAWHDFFFISGQQNATGLLSAPEKTLQQILPKWDGQFLSSDDMESLILSLAHSRFFEYTVVIAADWQENRRHGFESNPAIQEILFYADFIKRLKQITDEYYRQIAINIEKDRIPLLEKNFRDSLWREAAQLWEKLQFTGERPRFDSQLFTAEISKRFGAELSLGSSGNYSGLVLFMGHRIVDDTIEVEQYGRKGRFRFIVLEAMASNCYSGWFWDGRQQPGGWALKSTIAQTRPAYLSEPFEAWSMVTDPGKRSETIKLMEKETVMDDALARANPYAYLPGLKRRLKFDAAQRLYESLKSKGYENTQLCIAFVAELLRLRMESAIVGHEGRHILDELYFPLDYKTWTDEREFRAKLSQIVFSSDPKFTFGGGKGGIIDRNIGDNSQHGKANERIMKTVVDWMGTHTAEIPGIDTTRPLLPQFDKLTSDQIKALFAAADPMAAKVDSSLEPLLGNWIGKMNAQTVVFRFERLNGGYLGAYLDLPDQGVSSVLVTDVILEKNKIRFKIPIPRGEYEGQLTAEGILGNLKQKGFDGTLNLVKGKFKPPSTKVDISAEGMKQLLGCWQGKFGPISVIFRFEQNAEGEFAVFVDSPDQGATGMPATTASLVDGNLSLTFASVKAEYGGKLIGDKIDGIWTQSGQTFPLSVTRQK
jgi:hypothetical protein